MFVWNLQTFTENVFFPCFIILRIVMSSPVCTVYTLKYGGMHPFFTLMCTRIKRLGKDIKFYFPIWCEIIEVEMVIQTSI